jgi:predicted AlkP superfamily phosphohydrolase/phosphomutase
MKICILGLDCCAPEIIFNDERLTNIRRLMDSGVWGRLESVIPPITVPAWMCMSTSQDPGSLGVYGFRNRTDHSYSGLGFATSKSISAFAMWDQVAREGRKSIIIGVPPGYPPRKINGISVGCFLTPDTAKDEFTHPPEIKQKLHELTGRYEVDVQGFRTDKKDWLKKEIFEMSRKQWTAVKWLLQNQPWDYFHYVDIGMDRVHHGFWDCYDTQHVQHVPGNPFRNVIPEYYQWIDSQVGEVLEMLDNDTIVLLVSDHGARRLDGGFVVNEWLVREGLLVLDEYPKQVTPLAKLNVNWARTKVWSEGGYYARVFLNVEGREPQGVIPKGDVLGFRDELKAKFEGLTDDKGKPLGTLVFKPEEIYKHVRNVAPDLVVHFGALAWRSIGGVGYGRLHVQENDTGPDACNHAQFGMFLLAAPNCPLHGEYAGAKLLDIAPTLLDLAGYDIPPSMQGRSLVGGAEKTGPGPDPESEQIIHDRLAGLGYI